MNVLVNVGVKGSKPEAGPWWSIITPILLLEELLCLCGDGRSLQPSPQDGGSKAKPETLTSVVAPKFLRAFVLGCGRLHPLPLF